MFAQRGLIVPKVKGLAVARKKDQRAQRTRQIIQGALFSLIQEKGFETLSVQDIVDRANVGRMTFYRHFDNMEDLLVSGFEGLRASLKERQRETLSNSSSVDDRVFAFGRELFTHAKEHREVFRVMVGGDSGVLIQHLLHKLLIELLREDVKATGSPGNANSIPGEALVQFIAGGLFGLLMWWLEGKMRLPVEEVNSIFRRLAIPAVRPTRLRVSPSST